MKTAGHWCLALLLAGGLTMMGCESEDGGVTDPPPDPTPPGDITVGPDEGNTMDPLNAAVQAAVAGNTIVVNPGEYNGTLLIDKPLRFVSSAGKDQTVLSNETDTTTVVVQISGSFGSTDSLVLEGLGINEGGRGVHVASSSVPVAMRKCDIFDNSTTGVQVGDAAGKAGGDPSLSLWQCFFRRNGADGTEVPETAALWITTTLVANSIFFEQNIVDIALTSMALADVERMTSARSVTTCLYIVEQSEMTLDGISPDVPTTLRDGDGYAAIVDDSIFNLRNFFVQRFDDGGVQIEDGSLSIESTWMVDLEQMAVGAINSDVTVRGSLIEDTRPSDSNDPLPDAYGHAVHTESSPGQSHTLVVEECLVIESFRSAILAKGDGQNVEIRSSEFSDNGTGWQGAGIEGDLTAPLGGALSLLEQATGSVTDSEISSNYGLRGGGIAVIGSGASVTVNGGEIRSNLTDEEGGGIYVEGAVATLSGSRIAINKATVHGGGIAVVQGGQVSLDSTPVAGNSAAVAGGGVYVARGTASFTNGSDFTSNSSAKVTTDEPDGHGGAIFISEANVSLDGTTFDTNRADFGGAIYATTLSQDLHFQDCTFINNVGAQVAAAIYARDLTRELRLERCQIYDNELSIPDPTVPSTIFSQQDLPGGRLSIVGCTITDNRNGGGVIGHQSGEMVITESVVAFNLPAGLIGMDLQFVEMSCNDFYMNGELDYGPGANPGPGSISEDPLFCDRSTRIYTVDSASPLLPANNSCGVQIGARGQGCAGKL